MSEEKQTPVRRRVKTPEAKLTSPPPASEWDKIRADITKERGEGIVFESTSLPKANHIPTGAFTLDFALLGGLPEGHGIMFYGIESSGKTTMLKKAVAGFLLKHPDKIAVWVDTESMFDAEWAQTLGCDLSRLHVIQPETGEEAVDLLAAAMGALEVGFVVLDSVPGCVPKAVVDRSAEDDTMAALARLMGKLCSKILMAWGKERRRGHRVTVCIVNQIRLKVGFVMGNPQTLPGGRQINHTPTTKVHIKNKEVMGEDSYGNPVVEINEHSFQITKAKHGASIRSGEFQMVVNPDNKAGLEQGEFDDYKTVITFAKKFGLTAGSGGKYRLPLFAGDTTFAKYEDICDWLRENEIPYHTLRASIIAMQRASKGLSMLPEDGYLCHPDIVIPLDDLRELLDAHGPS